jgi:hypothetical protein
MISTDSQAAAAVIVLNPVSAANTAAATSGWIDVRQYEGDLMLVQQVGAVTGSITGSIEDASDGSGTGAAAITPNEGAFSAVSSANNVQRRTVNAGATRGWVRYVGTVVTGPALVAVSLHSRPKIV